MLKLPFEPPEMGTSRMPIIDFPINTDRRFVRLRHVRADGYVEFDFSIGDPELSVELILPQKAYEEFCVAHHVQFISEIEGEQIDVEQAKWRFGAPGLSA